MRRQGFLALTLALILLVSCVVFPNSLKAISLVALITAAILGLLHAGWSQDLHSVLSLWLVVAFVTIIHIGIGQFAGAPAEAALQVTATYVVSPLLWIYASHWLITAFGIDTIARGLKLACMLSCITVGLFYYLFFTGGADAVIFFIEEPNIDTSNEGYIGATMYVFGSLIFLIGGLVASFDMRRAGPLAYCGLLLSLVTAFVAGRSALLLAVFIGAFVNVAHAMIRADGKRLTIWLFNLLKALVVGLTIAVLLAQFDLEVDALMAPLIEKITGAGGEGRMQQFYALTQGLIENWGLGAGHGRGVSYTVSDDYPWRYEMVWLASAYRTGVLGAVAYALPFLLALQRGAAYLVRGELSREEVFLFGGFVCAFVASNTNPYVEAFVFQWMYAIPMVYFLRPTYSVGFPSHIARGQSGVLADLTGGNS